MTSFAMTTTTTRQAYAWRESSAFRSADSSIKEIARADTRAREARERGKSALAEFRFHILRLSLEAQAEGLLTESFLRDVCASLRARWCTPQNRSTINSAIVAGSALARAFARHGSIRVADKKGRITAYTLESYLYGYDPETGRYPVAESRLLKAAKSSETDLPTQRVAPPRDTRTIPQGEKSATTAEKSAVEHAESERKARAHAQPHTQSEDWTPAEWAAFFEGRPEAQRLMALQVLLQMQQECQAKNAA